MVSRIDEKNQTLGDWFIPAIECSGNVYESLETVINDLEIKRGFVKALQNALHPYKADDCDRLTRLGQQLKVFSSTLDVRLGLLAPNRELPWFRKNTLTNAGPFAGGLLDDPVFFPYKSELVEEVEYRINQAFKKRASLKISDLLKEGSHWGGNDQCLWTRLIALNCDWESIQKIAVKSTPVSSPFGGQEFSLNLEPVLEPHCESRSLRAFLLNVHAEVKNLRTTLDNSYEKLLEACRPFWNYQKNKVKNHYKKAETKSIDRRPAYAKSLEYMGFDSIPTAMELRQRYLFMAKKLHPDRRFGDDQEFKTLLESYQHLKKLALRS